jgi:hypothetical protein
MPTTDQRTVELLECLGGGSPLAERVGELPAGDGAAVVLLDLAEASPASPAGPDLARAWVLDGSADVIAALATLVADTGAEAAVRRPTTVLVRVPDGDGSVARRAAAEAVVEAVRGIVQSASLEASTAALRLNVVVAAPADDDDALRTLGYLSSADAGFVVGSTFDLRSA